MRKLMCALLLVLMICLQAACAETVEMGGIELTIPEGWRVENDVDGNAILSQISAVPAQRVYVTVKNLDGWDTIAARENGLSDYLQLMAIGVMTNTGVQNGDEMKDSFVELKDGGLAWKAVYKTEEGLTMGYLLIAADGKRFVVSMVEPDGDAERCMDILSGMLQPMQVQEVIRTEGLTLGIPCGFERIADGASGGMRFADAYGNVVEASTLPPLSLEQEDNAGEKLVLMTLLTQQLISGLDYSNLQVHELEFMDNPALVCSMDAQINDQKGTVSTLVMMDGDTVSYVVFACRDASARYAHDLMNVLVFPMKDRELIACGEVELAYPEGFMLSSIENRMENNLAIFSDQMQNVAYARVTTLTDEELAQDPRQLLENIARSELGEEQMAGLTLRYEEYENALALRTVDWKKDVDHVPMSASAAWILSGNQQSGIIMLSPYGEAGEADALLSSVLPAAGVDDFEIGNLKLHIPAGSSKEQIEEWTNFKNGGVEIRAMSAPMPDHLRDMIAGMGEQMGMEIFLSMWASEGGYEGITIEYTNENGMHIVRSCGLKNGQGIGMAAILDGETIILVVAGEDGKGETEAYALVNQVLGTR